jgi:pimeloyl-ACP methyl ester carboxylesterase
LAFYLPPSPLVAAPAGHVIWARQLTGAAALPSAAENLLVLYHSEAVAGHDTAVSGTVSIPPGRPPAGGWPVLSWAHGTTGVADVCAPSRDAVGHPSHIYTQLVDTILDRWVTRHYVVAKTDYEGLGTPGLHPYLVGSSEALSTIDIVVAARQLHPGIGRRWVVMGHSQGGHAALFTAALAQLRAPELELIGSVAIAPSGNAATMISTLRNLQTPTPGFAFLPLILTGAAAANPSLRLDRLLTSATLRLLAKAQTHGIDDLVGHDLSPTLVPADVFRPEANLGVLLEVLVANDPALLRLRTPALIVQGSDDSIVARSGTDHLVTCLRANDATIDYLVQEGAGHFDVMAATDAATVQWVDAR